jgi:hypothetical protein
MDDYTRGLFLGFGITMIFSLGWCFWRLTVYKHLLNFYRQQTLQSMIQQEEQRNKSLDHFYR